jgi:hypothetical protein
VGTGEKATDGSMGPRTTGWISVFGCAQSSLAPMPLLFRAAAKALRIIGRVHGACVILALLALQFTPIHMKLEGAGSSQPHVMNRGRLECCQI